MDKEVFSEISSMIFMGMDENARLAARIVDLCYQGEPAIQVISYVVAILHALSSPNEAQLVLEIGSPFDPTVLWEAVKELSDSAVGELFTKYDGRALENALIVSGKVVTYYLAEKEIEKDETTQ